MFGGIHLCMGTSSFVPFSDNSVCFPYITPNGVDSQMDVETAFQCNIECNLCNLVTSHQIQKRIFWIKMDVA